MGHASNTPRPNVHKQTYPDAAMPACLGEQGSIRGLFGGAAGDRHARAAACLPNPVTLSQLVILMLAPSS